MNSLFKPSMIFFAVFTALSSVATLPAWANDNRTTLHQEYSRLEFTQIRTKAIRRLQEYGYQVHSIQLKEETNQPIFVIFASKNGVRYVIKLTYPHLKIIHERREDWYFKRLS